LADELRRCRERIDDLDATIVALLRERMHLGMRAGHLKAAAGAPLIAAEREAAVLFRVRRLATAPLTADRAERIFRTIIDETRRAEWERLPLHPADEC
jgi:chorismate mutase